MSDPQPVSDFVKDARALIDEIVAAEDTNVKAMLTRKLFELLSKGQR